jgi:hypothetical protein
MYLKLIKLKLTGKLKMTDTSEYENTIKQYVANGQMTQSEADDLLSQKNTFDQNRLSIETGYKGQCVGYVGGKFLVADSHTALLAQARKEYPGKLIYFETVGSSLLG